MAELNLNTMAEAVAEMTSDQRLSIKPTKMLLWGPWSDEERAQAHEIVVRAWEKADYETP